MNDDDHLRELLDHPPRGDDPPRDAALTAAVMTRVRALPARQRIDRRAWWALAALVAIAALLLPAEGAGIAMEADDLAFAAEAALAALIAGVVLLAVRRTA